MKVVSLFDGVSCARVGLIKAGFSIAEYISSEIEKVPSAIASRNFPGIKHIGDIRNVSGKKLAAGGV